tara:strand:+ start:7872 stop:8705 length:834 start_codon:yes stop_codon:yes gene_type:complete
MFLIFMFKWLFDLFRSIFGKGKDLKADESGSVSFTGAGPEQSVLRPVGQVVGAGARLGLSGGKSLVSKIRDGKNVEAELAEAEKDIGEIQEESNVLGAEDRQAISDAEVAKIIGSTTQEHPEETVSAEQKLAKVKKDLVQFDTRLRQIITLIRSLSDKLKLASANIRLDDSVESEVKTELDKLDERVKLTETHLEEFEQKMREAIANLNITFSSDQINWENVEAKLNYIEGGLKNWESSGMVSNLAGWKTYVDGVLAQLRQQKDSASTNGENSQPAQ